VADEIHNLGGLRKEEIENTAPVAAKTPSYKQHGHENIEHSPEVMHVLFLD
jgi:hypothetical protein